MLVRFSPSQVPGPRCGSRLKSDVEQALPKKREIVIQVPLTEQQRALYTGILQQASGAAENCADATAVAATMAESAMPAPPDDALVVLARVGLQNRLAQLRKCCNHPYLLRCPLDQAGDVRMSDALVTESTKMGILDRLLARLHLRHAGAPSSACAVRAANAVVQWPQGAAVFADDANAGHSGALHGVATLSLLPAGRHDGVGGAAGAY